MSTGGHIPNKTGCYVASIELLSVSFMLHSLHPCLPTTVRVDVTYLLTPWSRVLLEKLTGSAASQEIPRISWNPKFHHRTHKCPPPVPIPRQLHPVLTNPFHFLKVHLNIILPSASGSPQWCLSLRFPHQNPVHPSPLPHTRHMPRPSHSSRVYHPHNIR